MLADHLPGEESEETPEEEEPCAICQNLDCYSQKVDPVKLVQSAEAKECLGCMLLVDALNKFHVDISSLRYSEDILSPDHNAPSLYLWGEEFTKVLAGDDVELEIYASEGESTGFAFCFVTDRFQRETAPVGPPN